MKHGLIAALALGCITPAFAQSQVTIYGSVDASVAAISNLGNHSAVRMDGGISQPDLIGFRGAEDLGDGMKAIFKLENGFLTDTGTMIAPGKIFNRSSWVGLDGKFGTVKLGRQVDFTSDILGQWSNGYQLLNFYLYHPGNLDGLSSQFPVDNAISYVTPRINGMQLSSMYGFGETPGQMGRNRTYSFGGTYAVNRLNLAIAYTNANGRAFDIAGSTGTLQAFGQNLVAGTPLLIDSFKSVGIGGGYQFESAPLSLNALATQSKLSVGNSTATARAYDVGLRWQTSAANAVNFGYTFSKFESTKWHQINIGDSYSLSKRTQLYTFLTHQRAIDGVAAMNAVGVAAGRSISVLSVGMHTSF